MASSVDTSSVLALTGFGGAVLGCPVMAKMLDHVVPRGSRLRGDVATSCGMGM